MRPVLGGLSEGMHGRRVAFLFLLKHVPKSWDTPVFKVASTQLPAGVSGSEGASYFVWMWTEEVLCTGTNCSSSGPVPRAGNFPLRVSTRSTQISATNQACITVAEKLPRFGCQWLHVVLSDEFLATTIFTRLICMFPFSGAKKSNVFLEQLKKNMKKKLDDTRQAGKDTSIKKSRKEECCARETAGIVHDDVCLKCPY